MKLSDKILFLKICDNLPQYAMGIVKGVEKAKKEGRELEISANSILFINRMFENREEK